MEFPVLRLKPTRERAVKQGHPWIFAGALENLEGVTEPGQIVEVRSSDDNFLGYGTAHPRCTIAVRLFTREREELDERFFQRRLSSALRLRDVVLRGGHTNAYRLVNGEGDRLPGFIVDVYGDTAVVQCLTAGADRLKTALLQALIDVVPLRCVYERSGGAVRREEGLDDAQGCLWGELPPLPLEVCENDLRFCVDIVVGQKTGFFLDQRENRALARQLASGGVVLNAFAYTGAFAVYAAVGGARRIVSVESSPRAAALISRQWDLNQLSTDHEVIVEDVFTYLRNTSEMFDLLVLDPPALVKRRPELSRGTRAYYDLHTWALRRAKPEAWLLTFSCSQHVTLPWFAHTLERAAAVTGRVAQVVRTLGPGIDHPTLISHPEGSYLKGLLVRLQ